MNEASSRWPLWLLALGIAVVSWFFVSYLPRLEELSTPRRTKTLSAPVTYDSPPGFIILNPEPEVAITVRGGDEAIRDLNIFQVDVDVEFQEVRPGTMTVNLGPPNVTLPEGLELVSIVPERLLLRIDRMETKILPITANYTGEPAAGAQPQSWRVMPPQAEVRGPESKLANLTQVFADVSLEGRALDFTEEGVTVLAPDPLVQIVQPGLVTVYVSMRVPELPAEVNGATAGDGT